MFSVSVIRFTRLLPKETEYNVIKYQLIKSSTSVGANYHEAQSAASRADFKNKVNISLKEMSESKYWLKLIFIINTNNEHHMRFDSLLNEANELDKILGAIVTNAKS